MNTSILRLSFLIGIIFYFNTSFSQKVINTDSYEKNNLKPIQSQKIGREKRDKESNALRTTYNERFVSRKYSSVDSIALSYLKTKHNDYNISEDLSEVKLINTKKSPGGNYAYFEQMLYGIPVYSSFFTVALNSGDTVIYVNNEFRNVKKYGIEEPTPKISPDEAIALAKNYLDILGEINGKILPELVYFESNDVGLELAWQVNMIADKPFGCWLIMVNANNGRIIHASNEAMNIDGSGMVYNPNPLTSAQLTSYGGNFVDNNDLTNSDLDNERVQVALRDIIYENGVYSLKGPYCNVSGSPTFTDKDAFNFTRDQDGFEAVMAYYNIDLAGRYVESLGYFEDCLGEFLVYPLWGQSGSSYYVVSVDANDKPVRHYIGFGHGGVDDAEDAEIIWHEYGHALQRSIGHKITNSLTIGEGSADYWACSYSRSISSFNWATLFEWGLDGNTRRADVNWVYPNYPFYNIDGYHDGQLWSSVLMENWEDLGRTVTDRLLLESYNIWGSVVGILDAAEAFMLADRQLYGGEHLCTIIEHFNNHGLVDIEPNLTFENETIISDEEIDGCYINMNNVAIENGSTLTVDAYGNIDVQNTIVNDNSKLKINAIRDINLNEQFEVQIGSELEINSLE